MDMKKLNLSKSILEMKFMKRTKDKVEKQQFQKEGEEYFGSQLTTRMKKDSGNVLIEPSYMFCKELINGRLSFQGINPVIEKLMETRENEKRVQKEKKQETDISDEQMTVQWQKIRTKFDTAFKRKRPQQQRNAANQDEPVKKKPKFLKPKD